MTNTTQNSTKIRSAAGVCEKNVPSGKSTPRRRLRSGALHSTSSVARSPNFKSKMPPNHYKTWFFQTLIKKNPNLHFFRGGRVFRKHRYSMSSSSLHQYWRWGPGGDYTSCDIILRWAFISQTPDSDFSYHRIFTYSRDSWKCVILCFCQLNTSCIPVEYQLNTSWIPSWKPPRVDF